MKMEGIFRQWDNSGIRIFHNSTMPLYAHNRFSFFSRPNPDFSKYVPLISEGDSAETLPWFLYLPSLQLLSWSFSITRPIV